MERHAIKLPFRLRKADAAAPVAGVYLPCVSAAEVVAFLVRAGRDPLPPVYYVQGGVLIKLTDTGSAGLPFAVRLRSLSPDLFLPVDAELSPALLPDEARALVRQRGLLFLPGDRVL